MNATITIFNHSSRPVPYDSEGRCVPGLTSVEADPTDPVCALSIEQGHVTVLAPNEPAEVANSSTEQVVFIDDVAPVAEANTSVDAASDESEGEVDSKPAVRKKSPTQASKES